MFKVISSTSPTRISHCPKRAVWRVLTLSEVPCLFFEPSTLILQFLFFSLWINQDSFHKKTSWSTEIAEERTPDNLLRPDIFNWGIQWNSEKYVWRHIVKELIIIWRTYWGNYIYIQCVTEKHLNISACMCFSPLFIIISFGATQFCNIYCTYSKKLIYFLVQ